MKSPVSVRYVIIFASLLLNGCYLFESTECDDGTTSLEIACDNGALKTRQCPAFYHPELTDWSPEAEGNVSSFSTPSGATALFTTGTLVGNDPYTKQGDAGQSESDISCELEARRSDTSSSPYPRIDYKFFHNDQATSAVENEPLSLTLNINTSEGEALPQEFHISLHDNSNIDDLNSIRETQYLSVFSVNNIEYTDVISQSFVGSLIQVLVDIDVPAESNVVKVLVARGVGLLQFELADGRVFTRNP